MNKIENQLDKIREDLNSEIEIRSDLETKTVAELRSEIAEIRNLIINYPKVFGFFFFKFFEINSIRYY